MARDRCNIVNERQSQSRRKISKKTNTKENIKII